MSSKDMHDEMSDAQWRLTKLRLLQRAHQLLPRTSRDWQQREARLQAAIDAAERALIQSRQEPEPVRIPTSEADRSD